MNARFSLAACHLVLALMAAPGIARAAESYDNCTGFITTLPAVISTQGTWCVKQDLSTAISSGSAISIQTNNVTIDCNDFKVGGLPAGLGTQAIGIVGTAHLNATIRHCNIRGFAVGIQLTGTGGGGYLVEDNRLDGNTYTGIRVEGDGSIIRRNRIMDTGESTFYLSTHYGILTLNDVDITENIVSGVTATNGSNGSAYGITTNFDSNGTIERNRVRDLLQDGTGISSGIYNLNSGNLVLSGNNVFGNGSLGGIGLRCFTPSSRARDNEVANFDIGIDTCTDAGGNDVH